MILNLDVPMTRSNFRNLYVFTRGLLITLIAAIVTLKSGRALAVSDQDIQYIRSVMSSILDDNQSEAALSQNANPAQASKLEHLRIVQFLPSEEKTVVIEGGSDQGVVDGAIFYSYRQRPAVVKGKSNLWIKTGKLKAIHVDQAFTLAQVTSFGDKVAESFFGKHANPMAGDLVSEARFRIVKNPIMTPTETLYYEDLFEDPKSNPANFELTETGKEMLRRTGKIYKDLHVPLLMIEGYTDANGPQDLNQVESYQRALTIRQFLIDELEFMPSRIVAIGYGESQLDSDSQVSGYRGENRRVMFKVNVQVPSRH